MYNAIDETLPDHPKCEIAAALLDTSVPAVIGHLNCLWLWAMKHAKDGDLTDFTPTLIATAAKWKGDPDRLIAALVRAAHRRNGYGFLEQDEDGGLYIHDWHEYGGRLFAAQCREAQRLREYRARKKAEREALEAASADEQHTNDVRTRTHSDDAVRYAAEPLTYAAPSDDFLSEGDSLDQHDRNHSQSEYGVRTPDEHSTYMYDSVRTPPKQNIDKLSLTKSNNSAPALARGKATNSSPGTDIVVLLCSFGVSAEEAQRIASAYPESEIRQQAEWISYRNPDKPDGMLIRAIKERWSEPPRAKRARQQAEADAQAMAEHLNRQAVKRDIDAEIDAMTPAQREALESEAIRRLNESNPIVAKRPGKVRDSLLQTIRRQVVVEGLPSAPDPRGESP